MEYLAPGVYVEEVSSGNKPIEGASTSTAGMVGVTQRGPVNEPILVTSSGDFNRLFGGVLDHRTFTENRDALPYAVQGFFNNGGQRLYVSRIIGINASFSGANVYAPPVSGSAQTGLTERGTAGGSTIVVDDDSNIGTADELLLADDVRSEYATVKAAPASNDTLRLSGGVRLPAATANLITTQTLTAGADLTAEITGEMLADGGLIIEPALEATLAAGQVIEVADTADTGATEYVTITTNASAAFDEGGLLFDHPAATTSMRIISMADAAATDALSVDSGINDDLLDLDSSSGFAVGDVVQINGAEFAVVTGVPSTITLSANLVNSHAVGVSIFKQVPMLNIRARYQGLWGNQVRTNIRPTNLLATSVTKNASIGDTVVVLDAIFGLSSGSHVEFSVGGNVLETLQVSAVNRATNDITFTSALTVDVPATSAAASKEYDLIVERLENDKVVQAEVFENLGMHPDHTRYGPKIVGSYNRGSGIITDSGESDLVRLSDLSVDNLGDDVAALVSNRASDLSDLVPRMLSGGIDDLDNITDLTYIGSVTPGARSGIHSLENEESISMVAVPGRTDVSLQKALIGHCERMHYRFAVIETPRDSNLPAAITHRQNYDTTRAAIYHPWLVIPDLFGERGDLLRVAPSGHVMGIYARTDTTRGVWKAPANEVVRGILQFESAITKGEQDILNPINVNAFRDFRTANRGLRLWGGRTLSSNASWKYVSVRRLFLFIEQSIERGLQFAVFEPNNETLWATVKQSISNFLIGVWRDGGLEGVTEEEAFFVNVGYNVTMTQTDIDNGRLIVEVGVAAVKPAEFVIIRIGQKTREATT
jgi:phage tail sheath protein FI